MQKITTIARNDRKHLGICFFSPGGAANDEQPGTVALIWPYGTYDLLTVIVVSESRGPYAGRTSEPPLDIRKK